MEANKEIEENVNSNEFEISEVLARCLKNDNTKRSDGFNIDEDFEKNTFLDDITITQILDICMKDTTLTTLDGLTYNLRDLDYDEFLSEVEGTSLEVFYEELIHFQNEYFHKQEVKKEIINNLEKKYGEAFKEQLKYTELLIFLKEKVDLSFGINITFTNVSRHKKEVRDNEYLKYIIEATQEYYAAQEYNSSHLTFEEALEKLRNPLFKEDLEASYSFTNNDKSNIDINNIPNEVVEYFAKSIVIPREITLEFLYDKKLNLEGHLKNFEENKNPGRKFLNMQVARLALNLSYLIRLARFIDQDEIDDIYQMKIKNEDLELIYKYVLFWGLKNKEDIGSGYTNVDNWIKTYKKQNPDSRNNINVKRINELRRKFRE